MVKFTGHSVFSLFVPYVVQKDSAWWKKERKQADRRSKTTYCPKDKILEIFLWIPAMGIT